MRMQKGAVCNPNNVAVWCLRRAEFDNNRGTKAMESTENMRRGVSQGRQNKDVTDGKQRRRGEYEDQGIGRTFRQVEQQEGMECI
jgi:hypothetical protein